MGKRGLRGVLCAVTVAAVSVFLMPAAAEAGSSTGYTVCAKGCAYGTIQAAINGASPGETITIAPGHYTENLTVTQQVTLEGSGEGKTVVYPAVSDPTPDSCVYSSLCGSATAASNMVLVQADNVTVEDLTLEGDNPALTSGVVVGGADIDARNGIIENFYAGTFQNLDVSNVAVQDVYLRGIQAIGAGYGETFSFDSNTVTNVQGNAASISMFNFGGSGDMSYNTVKEANDALSANWSNGTTFVDNTVVGSQSGIHTDNNGGAGGRADTISGNTVKGCTTDGYGIWVFAPYVSATISHNVVKECYVALAAFGSQVSGAGPTFSDNVVNGEGATTTDPLGTFGAYVTTDLLGYGSGDVNATFSGNAFSDFTTGLYVTQTSPCCGDSAGGQATVTASPSNVFQGNGTGVNGLPGTIVSATNDWWGCPTGPNTPGCDAAVGTTTYTPWLTSHP